MKTGRILVTALMLLSPISGVSLAQEKAVAGQAAPTTVYQARVPVALPAGEFQLASTILEFAPGAGIARHVHGGKVIALVLSGEITLREKGTQRVLRQGESWTEDAGDEHSVMNAGDVPVRVAVSMLLPKGAEATTMVKP